MGSCPSPISWSLVNMEERNRDKMSKPLIELITCESGEWEILRVNLGEDFKASGHSIYNGEWIALLKVLGFDVEEKCITDENMEMGRY